MTFGNVNKDVPVRETFTGKTTCKVCHVISGYYRNDPRIYQRQAKSLRDAGYQVSILSNDGLPNEVVEGISFFSCRRIIASRLSVLFFATWQFLPESIEIDADIYQIHAPELLPLGLYLKWRGKSVIYDAHEDLPNHILEKEWVPRILRYPLSRLIHNVIQFAVSRFDAVVTPHNHVAESLGLVNPRTVAICNFAKLLEKEADELVDFQERKPIVCYSGTVYAHSNQLSTLSAIENIEGVEYHIAGYISAEIEDELKRHPAYKKFRFLGRLPWEELRQFYDSAVVGLVVIGYTRNLGGHRGTFAVNKFFEYMEAGIPVICTNYDLWNDIIEEYECGISVEPGNTEQLSSAIRLLIENRDIALRMGCNGRRAVRERFNWSVEEQKYLKVFNSLFEMP